MRLPVTPTSGLCRKCGRDATAFDGEYVCEDCREHRPNFDRVASAMRFEGEARELVNSFKFREGLVLKADFTDILEAAVRVRFRVDDIDCVTAIPSTAMHRLLRGYNQCAELARPLAKRLKKPYRTLLRRIGSPQTQGVLNEDDRRRNIIGTFAPALFRHTASTYRTVLLVDDIMTTGSTLSEAARQLKAIGVERVWGVTLCRSVRF